MPKPAALLQGALDILILKAIAHQPAHSWGKKIELLSETPVNWNANSLSGPG